LESTLVVDVFVERHFLGWKGKRREVFQKLLDMRDEERGRMNLGAIRKRRKAGRCKEWRFVPDLHSEVEGAGRFHVCQAGCAQLPAYVTTFVKIYKPGSSNFTFHVSLPSSDVVILSLLDSERLAISAISWLLLNSTLCQLSCATYRVNPDIVSHMPDHRLYFESNQ
jgi:hypothetical protein